mgnify:CR=1 FL=1
MKWLMLALVLITVGCTRMVYIPVESVKTEYINKMSIDSIYLYDSVYLKEKGDTIFMEKYKYSYRDRLRVDTVIQKDSIRVPYPVIVEKKLTWWQRIKLEFADWYLLATLLVVGFFAVKRLIKK